jgi:glucose-6-phosphate isomerase
MTAQKTNSAKQWAALEAHFAVTKNETIGELFKADPGRAANFSLEAAGLFLDYSKNRLDVGAREKLIDLARTSGVEVRRDAMFAGERINVTENRSVLHAALRDLSRSCLNVDAVDILEPIRAVRERAFAFAERVRNEGWRGYTGKSITDVVNIGIGGSDLGPRMVCEALKSFAHPRIKTHFVANIDGDALADVLADVDCERTLFIIASKTFTTIETLTNARSARAWFLSKGATERDIAQHFVAVSTNTEAVRTFGIDPANMFGFWDWVGGRYSLWSSIGLPIMIAIGSEKFLKLLSGAHAMDTHFRVAPLEKNMPVILAMIGIWYRNFFDAGSVAVLPYSEHLQRLPAYLQQLDMESNGKSIAVDGAPVEHATAPIIWGEPGTNGQHAFFQLLHQGTKFVPIDFILPVRPTHNLPAHQELLVANCLAQSRALMIGKSVDEARGEIAVPAGAAITADQLAMHRRFEGNRPSNTILLERLEPASLGALIALYEHKVFVQGVVWNINSFDQWGVELGKVMANRISDAMQPGADESDFDASTRQLLRRWTVAKK